MRRTRVVGAAVALLIAAVAPSCGGGADADVTVFAAASLGDAFADIARAFEADHADVHVDLVLAGSSTLASQLTEGAPGDVVALADPTTMNRVVAAGRVVARDVRTFATNRLALAVPRGNPAGIEGLADLADVKVAVCAPQVPCGALTAALAAREDITLVPVTEESNVTSVLTKVRLDEVDAGFVYVTDLGEGVTEVAVPGIDELTTSYPIAALNDSDDATAFVAFVMSGAGQALLAEHGFGAP